MSASKIKENGGIQAVAGRRRSLVAAYRDGLGLAAIVRIRGEGGIRLVVWHACGDASRVMQDAEICCWCRRASDAERVATAVMAHVRRRESCADPQMLQAQEAIAAAAKRLDVPTYTDAEVAAEAAAVIARVDEEIERLQRAGELKSVNQAYRVYRTESSARGEKIVRYADWLEKYKETLVRELAAALRLV